MWHPNSKHIYIYIYIYAYVCVCVCVLFAVSEPVIKYTSIPFDKVLCFLTSPVHCWMISMVSVFECKARFLIYSVFEQLVPQWQSASIIVPQRGLTSLKRTLYVLRISKHISLRRTIVRFNFRATLSSSHHEHLPLPVYPDGKVCMSILHPPGDDPLQYEVH